MEKQPKNRTTLLTIGGHWVDFANPDPSEITIEDIAWGLAGEVRYANHIRKRFTVAQHSNLVGHAAYVLAKIGRGNFPQCYSFLGRELSLVWIELAGLLHDGAESYLRDMPKPAKRLMPDYELVERRLIRAIEIRFGLVVPTENEIIKEADKLVGMAEDVVLRDRPAKLAAAAYPEVLKDELVASIRDVWDMDKAERNFLGRFNLLQAQLRNLAGVKPLVF